ncbi:NfeD family protein [Luteimonas gilva]|uniref:NfeD family protein n=1 Tax=Luteimonas gilva TaxID=2572684 RepID=A0A4U5JQE9_9GAMM|nr:NfeD family protein [Luteimonas gilva]TKR30821.1 NfeD family protein [Luteimonas gilva]
MRWEVYAWAILALVLIAAETVAPGAFLMWLGFAAGAMFLLVLAFPDMPLLMQAVLFTVLAFAFVYAYRRWFRDRDRRSDQPALNRRTSALIGRVVKLESAIVRGRGRVQIADAYWDVVGPDMAAGEEVRIVGAEGMTLRVEAL